MIFDLQLFTVNSGIALGENEKNIIEIGSTGGLALDQTQWSAGDPYYVGFVQDTATTLKSNLTISASDFNKGVAVSYIDLNGDGSADSDEVITWDPNNAGKKGTIGNYSFTVGGSYISEAATTTNVSAFVMNGMGLTKNGYVGVENTALSSELVSSTSLDDYFELKTDATGISTVAFAIKDIKYYDVDKSGGLTEGDIITAMTATGTTTASWNIAANWTGASVYLGRTEGVADYYKDFGAVDQQATSVYSSTYLFTDTGLLVTSNSALDVNTGLTTTGTQTAASIELGTVATPGVQQFMTTYGDTSWAKDPSMISSISVTANALYGNTAAYTMNINNGYVSDIDLNGYQMNLMLTSVSSGGVTIQGIDTPAAVNRTISFNSAKNIDAAMTMTTNSAGALYVKNNDYSTHLLGGSVLNNTTVTGKQTGKITFKSKAGDVLNFGEGTDSAFVNVSTIGKSGGTLSMRSEETTGTNVITVDSLTGGTNGVVNITGLKGKSNFIINGNNGKVVIADSDGQSSTADTLAGVSIIGAENTWTTSQTGAYLPTNGVLTADLSGKGLEYVSVANHGVVVHATDWVFNNHSVVGAKGDNVLSIGQHSILDVEGGIYADNIDINRDGKVDYEWTGKTAAVVGTHLFGSGDADKTSEKGLPSGVVVSSAADSSVDDGYVKIGKYEVMKIESQGNTYNAFITSGASLSSSDTGINWNKYDIIVGDKLDLTGITDKKSVYLNNGLGKGDWDDTNSYSANMTSVISSSVGGSRIIGDYENSVYFYGSGHLDSLFGGYAYDHTSSRHIVNGGTEVDGVTVSVDTLASASGKKAWMGSSDYSGQTKVELLHNGMNTYNFGFVGEDYSVNGSSVKGTETDDTADVLTLMNGMGTHSLQGSEHSRANLIVGANASNNFTFQSISEGVHDILYTFELGKDPQKARVDTSLSGSTANFNYQDDVAFYLGFNNGTVLTMNADDSGKKVNYGGDNVIVDISTIDGSAAAGGNILNGQENHAEYIVASKKVGDTLCGGVTSGNTDTANDTLVGGAGADVFWVGAEMGNDVINNLTDGDTIVFLGSKFADATLNYENERMVDYADSHWMTVSFDDVDSTTKISITPGDGVTKHMSDLKDVTAVFDDGTYTWDGTKWSQA